MNQQVSTEEEKVQETNKIDIKDIVRKLTSRKFLMALVPAVAAICALFGYSENLVVTIASAVVIIVSSIGYMYTEGKCDQESIKSACDALQQIIAELTKKNETLEAQVAFYRDSFFDDDEYEFDVEGAVEKEPEVEEDVQ